LKFVASHEYYEIKKNYENFVDHSKLDSDFFHGDFYDRNRVYVIANLSELETSATNVIKNPLFIKERISSELAGNSKR
jgi:hypothetical protein